MKLLDFFKKNWILIFLILYIFAPAPFPPDFIPGFIDDLALLSLELLRRQLVKKKSKEIG